MLEILALWILTQRVGSIVEEEGFESGWFKLLTVVLWVGGELIGAIIGFALGIARTTLFGAYLLALGGAVLGAGIIFFVVHHPLTFYHWWRVAASLLVVGVFFLVGFVSPYGTSVIPIVLGFLFISIVLGTLAYQDILESRRLRFVILGAAILGWIILAIGHASSGFGFWDADLYMPTIFFSMAASLLAMLWSIVDCIRSKNTLNLLLPKSHTTPHDSNKRIN